MMAKHTICQFCDNNCMVKVSEASGHIKLGPLSDEFPSICSKAFIWDEYCHHKNRITKPLKNIGQRGEPKWEEISWDNALNEIAERLSEVIVKYGSESIGVSEMPLNHGFGGITRRLMNCLGTPNYIAPVELCMGNTAQVHRATYGWYSISDWGKTDLIVYFGQDRDAERWPGEYLNLKAALKRGAKLIEVDPRLSDTARLADHHLRIRYGTDAALLLAWLNVVILEDLYDHVFVDEMTVGFSELKERVTRYSPEWAADVCGIDAESIRVTARLYAQAEAAIIPWGVVGDMQRNSTSVLRCQCILRAICGYLNVSEMVIGPGSDYITNSELAAFDLLSDEKKRIQLGAETYPLLSFRGGALYREALEKAGIDYYPDILASSAMAHPSTLFAAMRGEGRYPVKAFFSIANNTVMSYADQQGIVKGFLNQDLVVVFEHFMTPTAQLADYVLPGDMWTERDVLGSPFDVGPLVRTSQGFASPRGECKSWFDVVKGLAQRLGYEEAFPWKSSHELYDYRLAPLRMTWDEAQTEPVYRCKPVAMGRFLTPSGKVELKSSVFEVLGYDPLPYYVEHAEEGIDVSNYPYTIFAGLREAESYNTNLHQIDTLRARKPEPELLINPEDAGAEGITEGDWVRVSTTVGTVTLLARLDDCQPTGTLRIPHGWWKPESPSGLAAGLSCASYHNDGVLFSAEDWNLDPEQGLANLRGGIRAQLALAD